MNVFQQDPVDYYGSRFLAVLIVAGIALVLYSLIRYRGRAAGPVPWGVLLAGVAVLPILVTSAGTVLALQRAERVEFCASCHLTMKPFVDDMKNPKSGSLASLHYANRYIADNQCYVCHTSYGLFGTFEAKKEGLHDVFAYYTRSFHLPVKLKHPYPNGDCLKCHGESVKWLASHADFKDQVFSGELSCLQCHAVKTPAHSVALLK